MSNRHAFEGAAPQQLPHNRLRPSNGLAESRLHVRKSRGKLSQNEFQIDTARRQVDQIEAMIVDFDRMASALEGEICAEEDRTGIHDSDNFAYSTYAQATIARRDNLTRTVDRLNVMLNDAKATLAETLNGAEEDSTAAPCVASNQVETSAFATRSIAAPCASSIVLAGSLHLVAVRGWKFEGA
jgi:hypothetical protein